MWCQHCVYLATLIESLKGSKWRCIVSVGAPVAINVSTVSQQLNEFYQIFVVMLGGVKSAKHQALKLKFDFALRSPRHHPQQLKTTIKMTSHFEEDEFITPHNNQG